MELIFAKNLFLFSGKVSDLKNYLEQASKQHLYVKDLIKYNLV